MLAAVVSRTHDIGLDEDVVQDAFVTARESWRRDGILVSPVAWLITTPRRKAIDRQRRHGAFERKMSEPIVPDGLEDEWESSIRSDIDDAFTPIPDERVRLIFTCCHPARARGVDRVDAASGLRDVDA